MRENQSGYICLLRGAVVYWLARPLGTPSFGVRSSDQARYIITCKNMTLNIRECLSLVGHGSSVVGALLRNLGKFFFTPHCLCLSDETP